jgi:hypothetical protein
MVVRPTAATAIIFGFILVLIVTLSWSSPGQTRAGGENRLNPGKHVSFREALQGQRQLRSIIGRVTVRLGHTNDLDQNELQILQKLPDRLIVGLRKVHQEAGLGEELPGPLRASDRTMVSRDSDLPRCSIAAARATEAWRTTVKP